MITISGTQRNDLYRFNTEVLGFTSSKSVHGIIEDQVCLTPSAPAVDYRGASYSYLDLNSKANQIAHWLIINGSGPDQMVGLCCERSYEMLAAILGILKSGAAYVPFDPTYPVERIIFMLEQSGIQTLLLQEQYRTIFTPGKTKLKAIDSEWEEFAVNPVTNPSVAFDQEDLAYVLFTSGSTGVPKGVGMVHRALVNLILWQNADVHLGKAARTLQFAPISFDVSFQDIFTTWASGGTILAIEEETRINPIRLLEFIQTSRVERIFLPFIALEHLAEVACNRRIWPDCLRDVVTAGEQLQITKHIHQFFSELPHCRLHNHYGPTETHVVTALTLEGTPDTWDLLPPIGKPIANSHVYLLDEELHPVPTGDQGEMYIAGASLARGYIGREDLTAERFLPNPFADHPGERMYNTGDQGRYLPDGNIQYLGRSDSQAKVRGYRVELGEVEVALSSFPGIAQAVVAVREDQPGDKRLIAYLVCEQNIHITPVAIRKYISSKLPDYMLPSGCVFVERFPKTPSGKIDRKALPKPDETRPELGTQFIDPRSSEEKMIAGLWSRVLRINQIGIDDNFFDLGGNSLLALQFIARLRQEYGVEVPVVKLFQFPTINGLLNSLSGNSPGKSLLDAAHQRKEIAGNFTGRPRSVEDGIAVIGIAGRFPGADNVQEMWENLLVEKETTSFFNDTEIDGSISAAAKNDPNYVAARGVITQPYHFDAPFFGINPRLAEMMDPQQRIFLEVCWEALENAGYSTDIYHGLIGIYAGTGNNSYFPNNVFHHGAAIEKTGAFQVMMGNEKDYIATRISHCMNLTGPAVSTQTACSTSLTAVAMACQGLWNRQCDIAMAGGISITCPSKSGHLYLEGGMLSSDGHTRPFDEKATGTVFSDGSGVVVLKRYREAVEDGDTIYAIIRGVGINNDGSGKASFTAPSVDGQARAIAMAQADANVSPESITYVETHGTATPLGDPIEVEALNLAFGGAVTGRQYCAIGSIKSNFGHLTAAAGVAGLIKTVLALKHRLIPPSLNYIKPNPLIDFENSPFYVNNKLREWQTNGWPRRAGVSSFGVGGTNVHVVVEEVPVVDQVDNGDLNLGAHSPMEGEIPLDTATLLPQARQQLLVWSARSSEALEQMTKNLVEHLEKDQELSLADVAFTLQRGRRAFAYRRCCVAQESAEVVRALQEDDRKHVFSAQTRRDVKPRVVFLFPGQGAQYVGMGRELYENQPRFREHMDICTDLLKGHLGLDLRSLIYPAPGYETVAGEKLIQTGITQPALFATEYALAKLWMSWGIKPAAMVGHSLGEYVAAVLAGVMSLEDGLSLLADRAWAMQNMPPGGMLLVRAPEAGVAPLLTGTLTIAVVNSPKLCVVSGPLAELKDLQASLVKKKILFKPLWTSHAFHSPMMDPIIEPFKQRVAEVRLHPAEIPIVSTMTGKWIKATEWTETSYWSQQLRNPVRFADAAGCLFDIPDHLLLEVGPGQTLSTLLWQRSERQKEQDVVASMPPVGEPGESASLFKAVGRLWSHGVSLNWADFQPQRHGRRVPLPTYPFERKRCWVEPTGLQDQSGRQLGQVVPEEVVVSPTTTDQPGISVREQLIAEQLQLMQLQLDLLRDRQVTDEIE